MKQLLLLVIISINVTAGAKISSTNCTVGGCSSQLCYKKDIPGGLASSCEWREVYECYQKYGDCGWMVTGVSTPGFNPDDPTNNNNNTGVTIEYGCGWKPNAEFDKCIQEKSGSDLGSGWAEPMPDSGIEESSNTDNGSASSDAVKRVGGAGSGKWLGVVVGVVVGGMVWLG